MYNTIQSQILFQEANYRDKTIKSKHLLYCRSFAEPELGIPQRFFYFLGPKVTQDSFLGCLTTGSSINPFPSPVETSACVTLPCFHLYHILVQIIDHICSQLSFTLLNTVQYIILIVKMLLLRESISQQDEFEPHVLTI